MLQKTNNIQTPDDFKQFLCSLFLWVNERPDEQKYSFKIENGTVHYTIRVWNRNRTVDLHKTDERYKQDDPRRYEQLFSISFYGLRKLIVILRRFDTAAFINELLNNKITAGKLKRYDCILTPMEKETFDKYDIVAVKKKAAGNRYKINKNFNPLLLAKEWLQVEEALIHPSSMFLVHRYKRGRLVMNGQVFKVPGAHGSRSFIYFSPKLFKLMGRSSINLFNEALALIEFGNKENVMNFLNRKMPTILSRNRSLSLNLSRNE